MLQWHAQPIMANRPEARRFRPTGARQDARQRAAVAASISTGHSVVLDSLPKRRSDDHLLRIAQGLGKSFPEFRGPLTWVGVRTACERFEIDVRCVSLLSSAWLMHFDGSWAIRINRNHSPTERLRSAAHELAHFVLHRNHLLRGRRRDMRARELEAWRDVEEDEANRFAEVLLAGCDSLLPKR